MKRNKTSLLLVLSCLVLWSCSKDTEPKIVEEELQEYFDAFVSEAILYDIDIDLSDLDLGGYIKNIETNGTIGQCISYTDGSKEVVIDERSWDKLGALEKEYVVFHELGHCVLRRSHNDTQNSSGICQSMMQSGEGHCESNYTIDNRFDLIKELFTNK